MSLTSEEVAAVRRTWGLVAGDISGNGIEFFMRFFKAHPDYRRFFKNFEGLSTEELKKSPKLKGHATTVMRQITGFVDNLDDTDALVYMINKVADNHHPRGVTISEYKNLFVVLATFLSEALGKHFDAPAQSGWTKVVETMTAVIDARLKELQ